MLAPAAPLPPFSSFAEGAQAVLELLHERLGFALWMVTRVVGEDSIVLEAADRGYGVVGGDVFRWSESFCSRMVEGLGPRIAPNVHSVAAYAAAPLARQVTIGAYVSVPIELEDGSLFGTLCALDPVPQPERILEEEALVGLFSRLLGTLAAASLRTEDATRLAEYAELHASTDALTGIANRRAWDQILETEEARSRRFGSPVAVLAVDLDDLKRVNDTEGHVGGDALLVAAAGALVGVCRDTDLAARTGGDEFALLVPGCNEAGLESLVQRVEEAFAAAGVRASIGVASRSPQAGLVAAWLAADEAMYASKARRGVTRGDLAQEITASSPA